MGEAMVSPQEVRVFRAQIRAPPGMGGRITPNRRMKRALLRLCTPVYPVVACCGRVQGGDSRPVFVVGVQPSGQCHQGKIIRMGRKALWHHGLEGRGYGKSTGACALPDGAFCNTCANAPPARKNEGFQPVLIGCFAGI